MCLGGDALLHCTPLSKTFHDWCSLHLDRVSFLPLVFPWYVSNSSHGMLIKRRKYRHATVKAFLIFFVNDKQKQNFIWKNKMILWWINWEIKLTSIGEKKIQIIVFDLPLNYWHPYNWNRWIFNIERKHIRFKPFSIFF